MPRPVCKLLAHTDARCLPAMISEARHTAAAVFAILSLLVIPLMTAAAVDAPDSAGIEFFETRIRPVLVEHCYKCHSDQIKIPKGNLRLDTRDAIAAGGDSGPPWCRASRAKARC